MTLIDPLQEIIAAVDSTLGSRVELELDLQPVQRVQPRLPGNIGFLLAGSPPLSKETELKAVYAGRCVEQWSKLVGVLFCRPSSVEISKEVLQDMDYFHHRSGLSVDFFCAGYRQTSPSSPDIVVTVGRKSWAFSPYEFDKCRSQLANNARWEYSGETELFLTTARKEEGKPAQLDLSSGIVCNLEQMVRDKAITSARAFLEQICLLGHKYKGSDPVNQLSDAFGVRSGANLLTEAVLSLLPGPVRGIRPGKSS